MTCLAALLCLAGCRAPRVELLQKKVKPVPQLPARAVETQRQAAWAAKEKAQETVETIIQVGPSEALKPAEETAQLTEAVSVSLGPPAELPEESPAKLAEKLEEHAGKLRREFDKYAERIRAVVGKEIEGTGKINVSYVTLLLGGGLLVAGLLVALYVTLAILSATNPVASVGVKTMTLGGRLAGKAVGQLVIGGNKFLARLDALVEDEELREKLRQEFVRSHKEAQDHDVQTVVRNLK